MLAGRLGRPSTASRTAVQSESPHQSKSWRVARTGTPSAATNSGRACGGRALVGSSRCGWSTTSVLPPAARLVGLRPCLEALIEMSDEPLGGVAADEPPRAVFLPVGDEQTADVVSPRSSSRRTSRESRRGEHGGHRLLEPAPGRTAGRAAPDWRSRRLLQLALLPTVPRVQVIERAARGRLGLCLQRLVDRVRRLCASECTWDVRRQGPLDEPGQDGVAFRAVGKAYQRRSPDAGTQRRRPDRRGRRRGSSRAARRLVMHRRSFGARVRGGAADADGPRGGVGRAGEQAKPEILVGGAQVRRERRPGSGRKSTPLIEPSSRGRRIDAWAAKRRERGASPRRRRSWRR